MTAADALAPTRRPFFLIRKTTLLTSPSLAAIQKQTSGSLSAVRALAFHAPGYRISRRLASTEVVVGCSVIALLYRLRVSLKLQRVY